MEPGQIPTQSDRLRMIAAMLRVEKTTWDNVMAETCERIAWELEHARMDPDTIPREDVPPLDFTLTRRT